MTGLSGATGFAVALLGAGVAAWPDFDLVGSRLAWLSSERMRSGADAFQLAVTAAPRRAAPRLAGRAGVALCAAVCLVLVARFVLGLLPTALLVVSTIVLGRIWLRLRSGRDRDKARLELAVAVSALADECSAGASLASALHAASGTAGRYQQDFLAASAAVLSGTDVDEVWQAAPELADLSAACSLASATGAQLRTVLSAVGDDLAADNSLRAAVAGILAGPLSSAGLLAMLPVVGVGLGMAMGAHPQTILLHTGWGLAVLAAGIGFDLAGVAWTVAIAARASP